ncbi:hypothetical protein [Dactylosporangium sp. CA-092794]|uniref:hypothetical protein n=1 Tax=Dactylosporangium sp. CA-092794 TaxID=3239929 RepID=UPI003D905522
MSDGYLRSFAVGLSFVAVAVAGLLLADRPGWPAHVVFRVGAVLAVMLLGALPRVTLAAGGLAAADFQVRFADSVARADVAYRLRAARRSVGAMVLGVAAAGAAWATWLALRGTPGDRLLALLVGLCLLVRSRLFADTWAAPALLLVGGAVTVVALDRLATGHGSLPDLAPAIAGMATGALLGTVQAALSWRGSLGRPVLRWLEATSVIALICVAAVSLGLVTAARAIAG